VAAVVANCYLSGNYLWDSIILGAALLIVITNVAAKVNE
jgi:hypothetical protein